MRKPTHMPVFLLILAGTINDHGVFEILRHGSTGAMTEARIVLRDRMKLRPEFGRDDENVGTCPQCKLDLTSRDCAATGDNNFLALEIETYGKLFHHATVGRRA